MKSEAKMPEIKIGKRKIGPKRRPFVIAEIGINHEGSLRRALKMVDEAAAAGCECVKFQAHVIEDEMIPNKVVPGHTKDSIWEIMNRCKLSENEDRQIKKYVEKKGMIYLSTPFSRAAAERLHRLGVVAYKIGSGECNNYPLIEHIARFGKPIILSTGMNDLRQIRPAVKIMQKYHVSHAILHCTSLYPTPYDKARLGALEDLERVFPRAVIGFSDHSVGNFMSLAAVALGASIIEKHFTSSKRLSGPDIPLSVDPRELKELICAAEAIHQGLGGHKTILKQEQPTIDFAYACVVSTREIRSGEKFSKDNIWVKRPGTGEIKAVDYPRVLGRRAARTLKKDVQIRRRDIIK